MKNWHETEFGLAYDLFQAEFERYYAGYPSDVRRIEAELDDRYAQEPSATAFEKKRWVYDCVARECEVKVFDYCPFYFEVNTGADRNLIGSAFPPTPGLGSWVMRHDPSHVEADFDRWRQPWMERDILYTTMYADFAHNAMPVQNILKQGFEGIRKRAQSSLRLGVGDADYLRSVVAAADLVSVLGEKFSGAAERMLQNVKNPDEIHRLERIRKAALRCPMEPAKTFFEALNTMLYMKELANSVDSAGVAILGRVDMILQPYLERDLACGRLTMEEARSLIYWFCAITDTKWDLSRAVYGTNTSLNIGGCDREGRPVFNDVTRIILDAYEDLRLINPKLQARIPEDADAEYIERLGRLASRGANVLSVFNDSVIIDAQTAVGKTLPDARDYVNGGCQEVLLAETEFNSRACCYLSPCRYLEMMMFPEKEDFFEKERILPRSLEYAGDYEEFSRRVFENLTLIINAIAWDCNSFERRWSRHNPVPIMSAGYPECQRQGLDLTQGGARYNDSSFALVGMASFIDSLWAIKTTVFDDKIFSYEQLRDMLSCDFVGYEKERAYLLNRVGKYGDDSEETNAFAAAVMDRVASAMSGMRNARGGLYEASVWSYYGYEWLKEACGAMPGGRRKGERLSRGINPAESTQTGIAAMLHSLTRLNCRKFPQTALTYLTLPLTLTGDNEQLCADLIRYFIDCGGSSADFDVLDSAAIEDALRNPQAHRDMVVRVCGYSARFVDLEPEMQLEVMARYQRS